MSQAGSGCLQLSHRGRGSPLGMTLECLASGLHENHDQPGKRLTQQQCRDIFNVAEFIRSEEASRALYAKDDERLRALIRGWPKDVRKHVLRLTAEAARLEEQAALKVTLAASTSHA